MRPSTITFDCYGTLVDWETGIGEAFRSAAGREGVELDRAAVIAAYHEIEPQVQVGGYRRYRDVLAEAATRVAERLGWPITASRADFLAASLPNWPLFEDTREALERLKSRFRVAILSNIDDDLLDATLDRMSVEFDWTITAEGVRSYKPAHAHFQIALDRLGHGAEGWLHAAQSYFHDIRPAGELGIAAVWVNRKGESQPEGPKPIHVVSNLAELADWLGA